MAKRFTTDNGSNEDVCLVDNVTGNEYESNFEDIVDLLNELHEENQERKRAMRIAEQYNEQLLNENKKLKKYLDSISKGGLE